MPCGVEFPVARTDQIADKWDAVEGISPMNWRVGFHSSQRMPCNASLQWVEQADSTPTHQPPALPSAMLGVIMWGARMDTPVSLDRVCLT